MLQLLIAIFICMSIGYFSTYLAPVIPNAKTSDVSAATETSTKPRKYFSPAPVITNLKEPPQRWIRMDLAYTFAPSESDADVQRIGEEMLQDAMALLRSLSMQSLEGPLGLLLLRDELTDRARTRSRGKVLDVIVRSMVIQ